MSLACWGVVMNAAARRSGLKVIKIPNISTLTPKSTKIKKNSLRTMKASIYATAYYGLRMLNPYTSRLLNAKRRHDMAHLWGKPPCFSKEAGLKGSGGKSRPGQCWLVVRPIPSTVSYTG
jgi:hypothetical protein